MVFNYLSFGYIPTGDPKKDFIGRFRGVPNLIKRLQARTVLECVNPSKEEKILDFGCGNGFFAYEFAKRGTHAIGVDIIPLPHNMTLEQGKVDFITVTADDVLPFADEYFDTILVSEVFIVLSDPLATCKELFRVLRAGGKIIVVNTLGRKPIEKAYSDKSRIIEMFKKLFRQCPDSYEEFCSRFLTVDGLQRAVWYSEKGLVSFLAESGFFEVNVFFPFKYPSSMIVGWLQLYNICVNKGISLKFNMPSYLFLELLNGISRRTDPSNIIIVGKKHKSMTTDA